MKPLRRSLLALGAGILVLLLGCGSSESCEAVLCEQGTCAVREERAVCLCGDAPCSSFSSELDRMRSEAVPLETMSAPREGSTSGGPAAAYFSFAAQAGHKYAFGCGPRSITTCKLRLFDAQGTLLGESEASQDFYILFRAPVLQTYYLAISSSGSKSGTFEYMFEARGYDDHGDFVAHVTPLQLVDQRGKVEGSHEAMGDQDVFGFPAVEGFQYQVTCRATAGAPDLSLTLLDGAGALLLGNTGGGATELRMSYRSRSTQAMYLVVGSGIDSESTGSYACELSEDEDGGSIQAARTLEPGIDAPGILDVDDVDFLALSVQPGRFYRISCVAQQGSCALAEDWRPPQTNVPVLIEAMNAETVFLYVTGPAGTRYVIRAEDLGTDDHGDTASTATPLTAPAAMTGSIQGLTDRDVFSFPGVDGHRYRIRCAGTAGEPGWMLEFFDPSGTPLGLIGGGLGAASELTQEAYVGGTYTAVVASPPAGRLGRYECRLEDLGLAATGAASAAR